MKKKLYILIPLLFSSAIIFAQPANDNCNNAQSVATNGSCNSGTTVGANDSWQGSVGCQGGGNHPDVWYSFVSTGTQAQFIITASSPWSGNVELVLVQGTCAGGFTVIGSQCGASPLNVTFNGLQNGTAYYYTISNTNTGTPGPFQTCLTTSTPPTLAGQDCNSAAILCNSTTFSQSISNAGFGTQEVSSANSCWGLNGERQSKWFKFTVGCSGTLEFNINPLNPNDDYDWALWDITSDPTGCTTKGNSIACNWSGCTGSTGLSSCISSEPGVKNCGSATGGDPCPGGSNPRAWSNWSSPGGGLSNCISNTLNVVAGNTYTLLVDNFTATNSGFILTFGGACNGGTAKIGPDADFTYSVGACGTYNFNKTCQIIPETNCSYLWQFGDGAVSTVQNPSHAYSTSGNFVITLQVTDALGCVATFSKTITITATPLPIVTTPVNYCAGASAIPLTAGGSNLLWYTSAIGGTGSTTTPIPSTAIPGTTSYYLTQTIGGCESQRAKIDVIISGSAISINSETICIGQSATLTATPSAGGGTFSWSPGGQTLQSITVSPASTRNYTVTYSLGGCSNTATGTVTVNTTALPTAASPQTFCNPNPTVANLSASGTNLQWYSSSTGGSALASTAALATGTYYVSQTIGGCESARTSVSVTVNTTALPTVASPQTFCNPNPTVANLSASGTNLQWYSSSTGGSALASTAALATGTYYVSQTIGGCESARTSVSVTVNTTALPTAASPQTFCSNTNPTVTNLSASGTNLQWYSSSTGGSALASTAALAIGTYYVSQTIGGCESARASVNVTVNSAASPTATTPQTFCSNTNTVANLSASGTNLQWYSASSGGSALATTTALAIGTYYVSQTIGGCESARTSVDVTISTTAPPTATSPQAFCSSTNPTIANLTASGTNLQWYSAANGGSVLATTTALATGTYYVSQTIGGCESARTGVDVAVNMTMPPTATSPQAFCSNTNPTVANLTASGTNLQWYSAASGGSALASTAALATGTYHVSQTVGGCESARASISVTVNTTALPAAVGPQTFCSNTNPTVANLSASGTNLQWYSAASGGSVLASTTALATGTYYVSQTIGGCESARASVSVTVNTTALPAAVSLQTFCSNTNPTVANLSATGTNLQWYSSLTGGTALASTTALATGTYYVSQTIGGCESARVLVNVTVNATALPAAVSPQTFCSNTNPTVANLSASGTNLQWYSASSGGSALASTTALVTGTYYVSQTIGGCESARASISVTVNSTALPTAASPQTFCSNTNPTVVNLTASGTNLQWHSSSTGGTALASTAALATGTYHVSQTVGGCESARASISVTVNTTALPAAVGPQTFCSNTNPTVANLSASGTNLQWYSAASGGSVLASTTALATGTYYVSQTIGGCESARASVSVTVNTTALPAAVSLQTFCSSTNPTVANLSASGTNLQWYSSSTGGTELASTTALVTGTYYVSQTVGGCESARASVSVTVNTTALPTAASPQTFCSNTNPTVANLSASGTNLQWYSSSTGGSPLATTTALATGTYYVSQTIDGCESARMLVDVAVNITMPAAAVSPQTFCSNTNPTVANLSASGTNLQWYSSSTGGSALASTTALATGTYYVSQTVGGCESARMPVDVAVNITMPPTAASPQAFCSNTNPTVANLSASGTNLQWYSSSAGGTALASTTALATGTYYVSQTVGGCESARASVSVTVNTTALPTAVNPQTFCSNTNPTVTNLSASGTNLQWYSSSTGGTALATTTALATGTYYVSQTIGGCESARTSVSVTVNTTALPTAVSPQTFCSNTNPTVANLSASGTNLQWYSSSTGGTALASTTALVTGTYYVSQTIGGCESARASVSVTVNTTALPTAASPQTFCSNANPTVANLSASGTNLQWYSSLTGGTALASTTALATGTYYVSQTIGGCESARTSVSVTVNTTSLPTAASPQTFCSNTNPTVANLSASGTNLQWYSSSTGGTALASTAALATGTYYVSQTIDGCESTRMLVDIAVNITMPPTAASPQAFCSNTNPTVANLSASGINLQWYSSSAGGTALASTTALATGTYYVSQTIGGCESARASVSVAVNPTALPAAASPQTFCSNTNPTVTNLSASGTNLQWYSSLTGGTALASTTALATGTYYVSQTIGGCESARASLSVTVNTTTLPTAVNPQTFCSNTNPTVTNLSASGTNLQWYSSSTGGSALASTAALATGTYYASQTIGGCESARISVNVTISSVIPSVSINASSTLICSGSNVTFTATATNGGITPTYQWKINGVNVAGETASTFTSATLANGDAITVVMISNDPCANPVTVTSNAVTITATSVIPSVSVIAGSTSICSGNSVTFTATATNGGTAPTYQWKINGVNLAGETASTFTSATLANGDAVTVVMTSNDPCANPTIATSNAVTITATSVIPSVSINASSTAICSGSSVTFTATASNGGVTPAYQWKINGVNVAGETSSTFTSTTLANGDAVTVVMTSNDPCANPATVTSNAVMITTTSVIPSVSINASSTSICSGGSVTFTATATNGGIVPTYQWKINGINVAGQTSSTFTSTTLANGDAIAVTMTSNDPCANPTIATSNAVTITATSVIPSVSINASSTSICSGSSVTFTATATNGGVTPAYQWKINGVNVAGETSSTFTSTTLANGDAVTVVMTSNDPCANPATVASNAVMITTTSVIPSVSINASSTSICSGGSVTFTATATNGGIVPTYQWKINGINVAGQTSSTFTSTTLANGDAIAVTMTSNDPCANPAIATSNGVTITTTSVIPSVSINASSTSICSGSSVTFTATATNGGAAPSYQWKINGVNVAGETASTFTSATLANGDAVTVVMTSNDPCANPAIATSNAVTITATSVIPSVSINASSTSICSGGNVTFTATATNGGIVPTYQWKINGINVAGQTASTFTSITLVNGDAVAVVMTSNDPCANPATATSNAITITATSVIPSVSINASSTSICSGSSVTFTATATNGGITPTYQWKINGVNVAGQTASTFTSTTLVNGDAVTVMMTSNDPCANPAIATSNVITITTTSVIPSVSVIASSTSICSGNSVTFTATATNGGTAPTYQWKINGVNVAGQTASTFTSTTLANGDAVTFVITSNDPCASPATATSNAVTITATSVIPSVSIIASSTSICSGNSVTFTATATNGSAAPTYQWKINGVNVAGQTASTFTSTTLVNGDAVTVMMTSNDPCANPATATSNAIAITATSVIPSVSIIASSISICSGSSVTFTATATNGGVTPTYQWKVNGVNVGGETASTFTSTTLANGDAVTVVMTSNDPCANAATATSNTVTVTATSVTPSLSIIASAGAICDGGSVTFTAFPIKGGVNPVYQWKINGVTVPGQAASTFTSASLINKDAVTAVMTSNDPCANPATAASNTVIIAANALLPGIRYPTLTAAPNVPLPLHARALGNNYSYQWSSSAGLNNPGIKDPVFTYDKKTEYTITLLSAVGCITVDTLLVDVINTPDIFVPTAWTPNGDGHNDYLFPIMPNGSQLRYFRIYNRWGEKVFETNIKGQGWNGIYRGKPQVVDVYIWTIEAILTSGQVYKGNGQAALLR